MRYGSIAALLLALTLAACGGAGPGPTPAAEQASVPADPASPAQQAGAPAEPASAPSAQRSAGSRPATTRAAAPATLAAKRKGTPPPAHPIPAAFRASGISPGAPSDDQVRAQLQQMYAVQAQARKLTAAAANFAGLLPWVAEPKSGEMVSVASVFTDYGLGLACGGLLAPNQIGVAHKTAPCGTLIDFTYGGRTLRVPVIDRGPYIVGREWDLTGATAQALGFPGLGPITWHCASC